ncbi:hypothetical protein COV25_02045 [candidate division WWE3 bacterium CG10_big_fil_rev_8_21_14_0_10_35_32]|nr:MAG: hypothetical protein COV25_02045 [candidate division WWE3 bacterium CG10_big_fil_rev_8_21_14_0_10_35_32]
MPKLYFVTLIIKILNRANFAVVSQKRSHIKLKGIKDGKLMVVIVPNHKEIAIGTFISVLKQAPPYVDITFATTSAGVFKSIPKCGLYVLYSFKYIANFSLKSS